MRNPCCFPFVVFPEGQALFMALWAVQTQRKSHLLTRETRKKTLRDNGMGGGADSGEERAGD